MLIISFLFLWESDFCHTFGYISPNMFLSFAGSSAMRIVEISGAAVTIGAG